MAVPPANNASNVVVPVTVPAGSTLLRAQTVGVASNDDADVYIFDADGNLVSAEGATPLSNETADVLSPPAGTYYVEVNGFAAAGATIPFTLRTFVVPNTAAGNLTVSPTTLTGALGSTRKVTVTWKGLTAGAPYLGWIGLRHQQLQDDRLGELTPEAVGHEGPRRPAGALVRAPAPRRPEDVGGRRG